MQKLLMKFTLKSDACFSRGDGTAGEVDIEVQHDQYGLPYLNGRALKGLLHEEAAELVDALQMADSTTHDWNLTANRVFGEPGSGIETQGLVKFGDATLPADFRSQVIEKVKSNSGLDAHQVLKLLTSTRTQTANDETGAPKLETLRVMRIIPRKTPFEAELTLDDEIKDVDLAFLAACIQAFRRAGSNKTRGMGKLKTDPVDGFNLFEEAI
jgi:CRISPR/Cas system CSM-associated protein Csm3 (group 7 of RAMP superfamily)